LDQAMGNKRMRGPVIWLKVEWTAIIKTQITILIKIVMLNTAQIKMVYSTR